MANWGMILFLVVFVLLYGAMNHYVLNKVYKTFEFNKNKYYNLYILWALATFSYIIASYFSGKYYNGFTEGFMLFASLWMGMVFLFTIAFAVYDLLRWTLGMGSANILFGFIIAVVLVTIFSIYTVNHITTKTITLHSDKVTEELRIAHLSDLHIGSTQGPQFLDKVAAKTNALQPDIVLITGDLIDGPHKYPDDALSKLDAIKVPMYVSIGNHEEYAGRSLVDRLLKQTAITLLSNEKQSLRGLGVDLIAIDDAENRNQVAGVLANIPVNKSKYTILMYHRPTGHDDAARSGIDLMLSGHTHNGQIWPFHYITGAFVQPLTGLHTYGNMTLYVSQGTGWWGPPMRLGSQNEIVLIRILPKK